MADAERAPLEAQRFTGLSAARAAELLAASGPNELPGQRPRNLVRISREVLGEPMFLLLIAAAVIYIVLGDIREAAVLGVSIGIVLIITILQERRSEHALARLRDLSSPRALVIRDGEELRIPGRDVVGGDIVVLREGDRIPADGRLLTATAVSVDESILTGESLSVDKIAATGDIAANESRVYSGSLIVRGFGIAEITATGLHSEIGKIGRALATLGNEPTPLNREVRRVVRWVATGGLLICATLALIYGAVRHDWLGGILAGITLAMGILPEEFPVVLTVFLAMGAWRLSRAGVLSRRMPAVETIGAVTVLAVDKTGTLTENRMRVALVGTRDRLIDLRGATAAALDAAAESVLLTAQAASEIDPFDPMERAIHGAARQLTGSSNASWTGSTLVREFDLTPELLAVTHVWQRAGSAEYDIAVKGAPETIIDLCHLGQADRVALRARVASQADTGLRMLAVARGKYAGASLPESPRAFALELVGFIGLADPLRDDVPAALAQCTQAGIRVVMITGDHPGTALAIARQAGFDIRGGALAGPELEALSDDELRLRAKTVCIYARARPEHKLRLVQAFKANGEIIAMTGDGVNDAPALKAAHVGVAMGERGTDVARESAALVLVKDDFSSLVSAVRLGRTIYDNIRHAMSYIVAVHIPIAGLGILPAVLGWPLLFSPMHVVFLEFVIDPACAFVFEADPEAPGTMRRRPRRPEEPLFSQAMLRRSALLGTVVLVMSTAVYGLALHSMAADAARALGFLALVVANLSLIFVSRSRTGKLARLLVLPNRIFWWIAGATTLAIAAAIYVPAVATLFKFARPPTVAVVAVALLAVVSVLAAGLLSRHRPEA